MKKLLAFVLISAMILSMFVGCSKKEEAKDVLKDPAKQEKEDDTSTAKKEETSTPSSDETTEVTTVTMWIMPNSGSPEEDLRATLEPFLEANPDIDVEITVLDWGSAWTKITTAATSGEGPDITQLGTTQVAAVAAMGALEDLSGIYDRFGGEAAFVEATLPTTQILGMGDGRYAAPWFIDTRALFYRKDYCEMAGVNPETDFETWDSFAAALEKLKGLVVDGKEIAPLMMPGKNDWNVIHNYAPWIWGAGGDFMADDLKTSVINSPEAFEGVKFYSELAIQGLLSMPHLEKNSAEVEAIFNSGDAAIIFTGAYHINTLRREMPEVAELVGTVPFPAGPKGRYVFFGGSGLCVFNTSKKKEAAYRILEYLMTTDAQVTYQKYCGNLPTVKKAFETEFVSEEPLRVAFRDQLQYGKAYPSVAGWGPSETILQKGLSNVWDNIMGVYGEYDPARTKEFLDQTASECTVIYSQQ